MTLHVFPADEVLVPTRCVMLALPSRAWLLTSGRCTVSATIRATRLVTVSFAPFISKCVASKRRRRSARAMVITHLNSEELRDCENARLRNLKIEGCKDPRSKIQDQT